MVKKRRREPGERHPGKVYDDLLCASPSTSNSLKPATKRLGSANQGRVITVRVAQGELLAIATGKSRRVRSAPGKARSAQAWQVQCLVRMDGFCEA